MLKGTHSTAMRLTRREMMGALTAFGAMALAPGAAIGRPARPPIQTLGINHVALAVSDPKRTIAFYQDLFGMPIQASSAKAGTCLRVGKGPQFLQIMQANERTPVGLNHYCLAVEDFDSDKMLKILMGLGVDARAHMRSVEEGGGGPGAPDGTPELSVQDPDNIRVQLQNPVNTGGGGMRGEIARPVGKQTLKAAIAARDINHCTIFVSDVQRTVDFYQRVFGLFQQVKKPTNGFPDLGIGYDRPGPYHPCLGVGQFKGAPVGINHVCLGVENFNHERIMRVLAEHGVKSGEGVKGPMTARVSFLPKALGAPPGGTPELFFNDPDGISIQLQDVSFCGEANAVNGICPN